MIPAKEYKSYLANEWSKKKKQKKKYFCTFSPQMVDLHLLDLRHYVITHSWCGRKYQHSIYKANVQRSRYRHLLLKYYVYTDISNLIIYLILNKTILWLRILHELILE